MKRRSFLKRLPLITAPVFIGGFPIRLLAGALGNIMGTARNDKVVVIIQLAGGNDGLNAVIPVAQYETYFNYRSNIAIPQDGDRKFINLDESFPLEQKLGLHPDMAGFKSMYDERKAMIIQNVGYENMNMSHFRGRDIWYNGGNFDDYYPSGWAGRFLNEIYPGYPDDYPNPEMPDPLALEFGYTNSLLYQRETGIPTGLAITDPASFYDLINNTGIQPPAAFPENYAGEEMKFITDLELKSNQYAQRLFEVYEQGSNSPGVVYPETYPHIAPPNFINNPLSDQLKMVARLLSGGIKTRFFLLRIDGWDTHAEQVIHDNPTMGIHAALLYHLTSSVQAFQEDLADLGLEDRVLTMTTSEFGRRVYSNDSNGTDHGQAAPVFLFGSNIKGGVIGSPPDLNDLNNGNLKYLIDYRQLYTSVLFDWMGATYETIEATYFEDFMESRLDILTSPTSVFDQGHEANLLVDCYPNPAKKKTVIRFDTNGSANAEILLIDSSGKMAKRLMYSGSESGKQEKQIILDGLKNGLYLVQVKSGSLSGVSKLIIKH